MISDRKTCAQRLKTEEGTEFCLLSSKQEAMRLLHFQEAVVDAARMLDVCPIAYYLSLLLATKAAEHIAQKYCSPAMFARLNEIANEQFNVMLKAADDKRGEMRDH